MKSTKEEINIIFKKHVPDPFVSYLSELFCSKEIILKIKSPRKTKLGDFRPLNKKGEYQITINKDLNVYAFLITSIHEFAHLVTHEKHKQNVNPHGKEWKATFQELLKPIIKEQYLPLNIYEALLLSQKNTRSSSCLDYKLYKELAKYDTPNDNCFLEKIQIGTKFQLNGRIFVKGKVKRTRFLCTEEETQKKYMVQSLAKVKPMRR